MTTHAWARAARLPSSRATPQARFLLPRGPVLVSFARAIAIMALFLLVFAGVTDLQHQFGSDSSVSQPRPSPVPQSPPLKPIAPA
jgi:hypothetical protein